MRDVDFSMNITRKHILGVLALTSTFVLMYVFYLSLASTVYKGLIFISLFGMVIVTVGLYLGWFVYDSIVPQVATEESIL